MKRSLNRMWPMALSSLLKRYSKQNWWIPFLPDTKKSAVSEVLDSFVYLFICCLSISISFPRFCIIYLWKLGALPMFFFNFQWLRILLQRLSLLLLTSASLLRRPHIAPKARESSQKSHPKHITHTHVTPFPTKICLSSSVCPGRRMAAVAAAAATNWISYFR